MPSLPALAATLAVLALVAPRSVVGQQGERVATVAPGDEWFLDQPRGKRLARLEPGTVLALGRTEGDWQEVTLEGVIWTPSVGPAPGTPYALRVTKRGEENLRDRPNGAVRARLLEGFLLERLGAEGNWTRVRRTGWVRGSALAERRGAPTAAPAQAVAPAQPPTPKGPLQAVADELGVARAVGGSALLSRPDGDTAAMLGDDAAVRVLSRRDGWVQVRMEGWVRAADVSEGGERYSGATPADLRSSPDAYRGKLLRWPVQFIALRTADELRPDIPLGQRYLLVRGPLPGGEFVYVIVPAAMEKEAEALVPLAAVTVTARVRVARARYLGNPVLELVTLETEGDR